MLGCHNAIDGLKMFVIDVMMDEKWVDNHDRRSGVGLYPLCSSSLPGVRSLLPVRLSVTALYVPTSLFAYASRSGKSRSNGSLTRVSPGVDVGTSEEFDPTGIPGTPRTPGFITDWAASDCGRVEPGEPQDEGKDREREEDELVEDMR